MMRNKQLLIISFILILGFSLRLYGSDVPWFDDEPDSLVIANDISFNPNNPKLPAYGTIHGPLTPYLIKLSTSIFGETPWGARFLGIILGTLSILVMYQLVKEGSNKLAAIFSMIILSLDATHIFRSKYAADDIYLLFFGIMALWSFSKAINRQKGGYLIWSSLFLSLGFLARETILFFLFGFLLVLAVERKNLSWLKRYEIVISLLIFSLICSPYLYWIAKNEWIFYKINSEILGLTIFPTALLGVFMTFLSPYPRFEIYNNGFADLNVGFNSMGLLAGLIVLVMAFLSLRNLKDQFVKFLALVSCIFFAVSFFVQGAHSNHFKLIIIPIIALSGICLSMLWEKKLIFKKIIILVLLLFLMESVYYVMKIKADNKFYSLLDLAPFGLEQTYVNENVLGEELNSIANELDPSLIILPSSAWDATGYYLTAQSGTKTLSNLQEQKYYSFIRSDFQRTLIITIASDDTNKLVGWFEDNDFDINRLGEKNILLDDSRKIPVNLIFAKDNNAKQISKNDIKKLVYNIDQYE